MNGVLKELALIVVGGLIVRATFRLLENRLDGKDFNGKDLPPKKNPYVDWKGDIHLGPEDCKVV